MPSVLGDDDLPVDCAHVGDIASSRQEGQTSISAESLPLSIAPPPPLDESRAEPLSAAQLVKRAAREAILAEYMSMFHGSESPLRAVGASRLEAAEQAQENDNAEAEEEEDDDDDEDDGVVDTDSDEAVEDDEFVAPSEAPTVANLEEAKAKAEAEPEADATASFASSLPSKQHGQRSKGKKGSEKRDGSRNRSAIGRSTRSKSSTTGRSRERRGAERESTRPPAKASVSFSSSETSSSSSASSFSSSAADDVQRSSSFSGSLVDLPPAAKGSADCAAATDGMMSPREVNSKSNQRDRLLALRISGIANAQLDALSAGQELHQSQSHSQAVSATAAVPGPDAGAFSSSTDRGEKSALLGQLSSSSSSSYSSSLAALPPPLTQKPVNAPRPHSLDASSAQQTNLPAHRDQAHSDQAQQQQQTLTARSAQRHTLPSRRALRAERTESFLAFVGQRAPLIALRDHQGNGEQELSFRAGDVLLFFGKDRDQTGYVEGALQSNPQRSGWFPSSYVRALRPADEAVLRAQPQDAQQASVQRSPLLEPEQRENTERKLTNFLRCRSSSTELADRGILPDAESPSRSPQADALRRSLDRQHTEETLTSLMRSRAVSTPLRTMISSDTLLPPGMGFTPPSDNAALAPLTVSSPTPSKDSQTSRLCVSSPDQSSKPTSAVSDTTATTSNSLDPLIDHFNKAPEKAIAHALKTKLFSDAPAVAAFLIEQTNRLDHRKIGEYLGELADFPLEVLDCVLDSMNFDFLDIDIALRRFLHSFLLPGEAQKIDRLMGRFAKRYYGANSSVGIFASEDAVYILSYSIIMLNTDLHNVNIKKKMSVTQFISNNRGINEGEDLPQDFLFDLYSKISSDELKLSSHDRLSSSVKRGWILCVSRLARIGSKAKWSRRWCILDQHRLIFFKTPQDRVPRETYPLMNVHLERDMKAKKKCSFLMRGEYDSTSINSLKKETSGTSSPLSPRQQRTMRRDSSGTHHYVLRMAAEGETVLRSWMESIRRFSLTSKQSLSPTQQRSLRARAVSCPVRVELPLGEQLPEPENDLSPRLDSSGESGSCRRVRLDFSNMDAESSSVVAEELENSPRSSLSSSSSGGGGGGGVRRKATKEGTALHRGSISPKISKGPTRTKS